MTLSGCGRSSNKPGPVILQCVPDKKFLANASSSSSSSSPSVLDFKFSQPDPKDRAFSGGQSAEDKLVANHEVKVSLEHTIVVMDTKTVLEVVRVVRVLLDSASSE